VSEIMVNGPERVFVERSGKLAKDPEIRFLDSDHVRRVIDKIVSQIGRRIDESTPMVDARLPDGSRVNAVIAPLAIGGPFLTIRKFSADPLQIEPMLETLATLDWVSRLDEPVTPRHVLLCDPATTALGPLLDSTLLKPGPATAGFVASSGLRAMTLRQALG
jgi:pilus assembly protein CpaF